MYQERPVSIRQYISALCAAAQLIQEGMQIIHGHRKVRQPARRDRYYTVRPVGHRRQVQGQQDIIIQVFQLRLRRVLQKDIQDIDADVVRIMMIHLHTKLSMMQTVVMEMWRARR